MTCMDDRENDCAHTQGVGIILFAKDPHIPCKSTVIGSVIHKDQVAFPSGYECKIQSWGMCQ